MGKYSWDFDGDAEFWNNGTFDTVDECIEDAIQFLTKEIADSEEYPTVVYIGENREFVPEVDGLQVLEALEEQASEQCGEVGSDWETYDWKDRQKKEKEISELKDELNRVLIDWLTKYGRMPNFYTVENIKEYPLNLDAGEGKN